MNLADFAMSGWGKSNLAQELLEKNLPDVDIGVVMDYDDEYRGLVTAGFARWGVAGPVEAEYSVDEWYKFLLQNKKIVIARYMLNMEDWQLVIARIALAFRRIYEEMNGQSKLLIAIDEAHNVCPQSSKYPKPIRDMAMMGRGEGLSTIWISQRMATVDKNILGQCNATYFGGFNNKNDLKALPVDYAEDIHNPRADYVNASGVPTELLVDGKPLPLRKFTNEAGETIGSEWIYSDETGTKRRVERKNVQMKSTHYGSQGYRLKV